MNEEARRGSTIGFIGQGYVGKHYADDFEARGFSTVRYSLEPTYANNKEAIRNVDIVFIAVPTPTTNQVFDGSIVDDAISLTKTGAIVVVKSTIVPGTTKSYQERYPDRVICYSPEFLSEATAAHDAAHPFSNIVGITRDIPEHRAAAELVHKVLPAAPFALTCDSTEAELIKYAHNTNGYMQVVLWNLFYDLAAKFGSNWSVVQSALSHDPYVSHTYLSPVHKTGRGAGGHCFIKDFAALRRLYEQTVGDPAGIAALSAIEGKNVSLLKETGKDLDLLRGVYGGKV